MVTVPLLLPAPLLCSRRGSVSTLGCTTRSLTSVTTTPTSGLLVRMAVLRSGEGVAARLTLTLRCAAASLQVTGAEVVTGV